MNLSQGVPWTISCQVKPQRFVWQKSFVLGPRFRTFSSKASPCAFCTFRCGLLFGLWSFLSFFWGSLAWCFSFIYLKSHSIIARTKYIGKIRLKTSLKYFNPQNWDWKLWLKKRQNPTKTGRYLCRCWFSWASRRPGIIRHCPLDLTLVAAGNWSKDLGLSTSSTLLQQKLIRRKGRMCILHFRVWSFVSTLVL